MDNIGIIHKILKALEEGLDYDEFNVETISPEVLKISQARWDNLMIMLAENVIVPDYFLI